MNRISELHEADFSGEAAEDEQRLQVIEEGEREVGGSSRVKEEREKREEMERERRERLSPGRDADADTPGGEG